MRIPFLVIILFCCNSLLATGDSLNYLTPQDTVLLEINFRGQKLFRHSLERGQTLYSLSKFYGLNMNTLSDYNPKLKAKSLKPGTEVIVPIPNKAIMRTLKPGTDRSKLVPVCYKVKRGDTMYGVATRAFRTPVDSLMKKNNLEDYRLEIGQVLSVGWMTTKAIPKDWQYAGGGATTGLRIENQTNKTSFLSKGFYRKTKTQKGKAQWNSKDNTSLKGLYCLHKYAPKGSIVRIENPITHNVTYAKVLGKIPYNYEEWVVIVVSEDVAKALKAIDAQFFVKVEYFPK